MNETAAKTTEKPSKKLGGRPKGSLNKTTATAKENIIAVFTRVGGTAKMAKWANDNLTEFYKLYARLVPVDTRISDGDGKPLRITVRGIAPRVTESD